MKVLAVKKMLCPCCMEVHDVKRIETLETNVLKGTTVEYIAEYFYCDLADEIYANEEQISKNDIAFKNAYNTYKRSGWSK